MAGWKKVIVSGSTANLANVQVDGLTSGVVTGASGNLITTAIDGTGNIVAATALSDVSSSLAGRADTNETAIALNTAKVTNVTTNLGYTAAAAGGTVTSSDGTDASLPVADSTNAGLLEPGDFDKLGFVSVTQAVNLDTIESDVSDLQTDSGSFSTRVTALEGSDFNYNLSIGADSGADDVVADGSTINFVGGTNLSSAVADDQITFSLDDQVSLTGVTASLDGNAGTATTLETARTIGGVSFDGSANIDLPGVNTAGNQNTSGNAATATTLATARNIGGVSFDGSADISLPGVNAAGNQDTSGNAASATALETARNIGGVSFDGSADITLPGVNAAGNQNTSGNAATATALATSREFSISGDATATAVSFDGSGNVALSVSLDDDVVGADEIADSAISNIAIAAGAAIAHTKLDFVGSDIVSGSAGVAMGGDISGNADDVNVDAIQGVAITAGEAGQIANINNTTISGTQWGYLGALDQSLRSGDDVTFDDLTLTGNLTVQGTTTTLSTTNLEVTDQFISLNDGGGAADGGLVVEGAGSAFGWDNVQGRWAFDYAGATSTQTTITSDAYAAAVVSGDGSDANYQKNGNIRVDSDDIYIYTE